jgi:hypothetical protein
MPAAQALPTHLNISHGTFDDLERQCHEAMMVGSSNIDLLTSVVSLDLIGYVDI